MDPLSAASDVIVTKFAFGQLVATPNGEIMNALTRHFRGDWGTLDKDDWNANERALKQGGRLFSVYHSSGQSKFYIITEADRSATTVLLPEDY